MAAALARLSNIGQASPVASRSLAAIETPWCLAAGAGTNAAGYLVIHNTGYAPDRLTAITSPAARRVPIPQSRAFAGVASIAGLAMVEIPARISVVFAPSGLHFMLEILRRPFNVGERAHVMLWFDVSGPVRASLAWCSASRLLRQLQA